MSTSPSQVPWQNVFWALVAIALNTCLQDCGRVCELPKEFALLLRSSPVYCLLDSLVVMFQLCYYSMQQGPRKAVQIISSCRDQHPIHLTENNIRLVQYIMRGLLVVMAILQAIKLFAMKGILWTQLFGACYLLSYVVNGIINVFGKAPSDLDQETPLTPRRGDLRPSISIIHWISILAYSLQIFVWTEGLKPSLPDRLTSAPESATDWCLLPLHLLTAILWSPFFVIMSFVFWVAPPIIDFTISVIPIMLGDLILWMESIKGVPSLTSMLGSSFAIDPETVVMLYKIAFFIGFLMLRICKLPFCATQFVYSSGMLNILANDGIIFTAVDKTDHFLVMLSCILLTAFLSYSIARIFMFGVLARPLRFYQHKLATNVGWSCLFLFSTNVIFAILFYSKVYNPQHTSKPTWIENLPRALQ